MRILYGVVGEGMGHAMRSRVILEHLISQGHEIEIMASGRAKDFLETRLTPRKPEGEGKPGDTEGGADVNRIHGFFLITEENRIRLGKTVWLNAIQGAVGVPKNIAAYFEILREFRPQVVISDFESWTYLYGKTNRLPILSIDNMQIINRCTQESWVHKGHEADFHLARTFVKTKLPFCDEYFITTFFYPPVRRPHTHLFPPILRPEILLAKPTRGEHLLVYQTAEGYDALVQTLKETRVPCRIYGMRRDIKSDLVDDNLTFRPFSETGFVADLAQARGVIAGGGFTTMGEAVYLRKPMLSVPIAQQFEQIMNARYLESLGYGLHAPSLDDPQAIQRFVHELPRYEAALLNYTQDGNAKILGALDEFLDRAAAGVA